ncbi:hypothetical protein AnigIFM60653_003038 [Aspergillus niger]|nr:hypothetical protein AnigIFM60653_003038 [Aspergillus niger]
MDPEQTATEITIRKDFLGMLQIWPPEGSHNRTNFDLVLVPGLAGGCISTWIHENGNCWLDWLLREITDIRIFAFGYNADNVYLSRKDEQANSYSRVFTDAERLCNGLNDIEGRVEVVEESSSALNLPNEIRLCFSNTTHLTMCKFSNTEDVNYKNLRNRIVAEIKKRRNSGILEYFLGDNELRRKVPLLSTHEELDTKTLVVNETQSRMNQNNDANENLRSKMLKWLIPKDSAIDYDAELESNRVKPVAGTCMWIFKTKEYGQWIKGHPSKLFWVHGISGCGKSTLVASTCRSIRAERKKILHFFFTPESSFSTAFALSSLTQQMVCKSDIVLQALQQKYEHTVASPSRSEPAAAAVTKIALKAFGDCFIFLDAIDNCKDRGELLRNLKNFLDEFPEGIKIFCSSLNEHDIGRAFSNDSTVFEIEMSNTLIKGDIESFIRTAVDQNIDLIEKLNYCPGDKERIIGKLVEGAGGMFLLPKYFIDDLSTLANLTEMYKYLDDLPDGIQNYYLRIISKIDPRCLELTREVFTWAAWASRPLSLGEIRQAFRDDFLCLKQDLKRALGSLINLDDGFVRLSHDTIRRFIRNSEAFKSSPSYKALVHSTPDDYIAKTCVEFLSTPDLNLPSSPQHRFAGQRAAEIRQICPFLEYASCNWVSHWAAASMPLRLLHMISQFFDSDKFLKWLENLGHFLVSEGFESMVSMLMEQLIKLQQRIQRLPRRKNDLIRGWLFLFRLRKISRKVSELSNFLNSWGTVIQNFPDEIHILAPLLEKSFSTHPSQQVFLTRFLELSKTSRLYDSPDGMMLPSTYDRFLLSDLHVFVWRSLMPSFSWNLSCVPLDPDKPGLVALMSISMATRLPHRREGIDPAEVGSLTVTTALRKDHRVVGMAWARFSQDKEQPLTVKTYAWRLTQDPMSAHLVPLQWTYMGNDDPCRVDITHTRTFRMSRCAVAFTEDMETMWTCSGPYNIRTGHRQANPALFTNIRMSELSFSQNCSIVAGIRDHAYLEIYDIPRLNCVASYRGDCTILGVSQRGKFVLFLEKLVSGRSTPETVKSPQRPQYAVSLFSRFGTKTTIWSDDDNYKIQAQRRNQSPSGVTESLSMKMLYNNGGLHAFSQNDKILALCVYALPDWKLLAFDLESADIRRSWWSIDYASTLSGAGIRSLCFCPINERRLYLLDNYGVIRPFDVARADSTNSTEPVTSQRETPPPLTVLVPETSEQPVITITPAFR